MIFSQRNLLIGLAPFFLMTAPVFSALTYSGCPDVKSSDFTVVPLVNNAMDKSIQEPIKMAFDQDALGNVDVYFTQRFGKVRKYDGAKKAMVTLADFAFTTTQVPLDRNSAGLNGIALDPNFKTNHWIYLYIGLTNDWRVSRFVVNGDKLDLASERPVFRFNAGKATTHVAGALKFDWDGNLWITAAENEQMDPSANTNSYLGKILRIKPKPFLDTGTPLVAGAGVTYDIPAGNLFLPGTVKTLPEIYVMGARNPYTIALDSVRKGVAWGDVGPDGFGETEEFNFATKPGNFGYPFWAGNQKVLEAGHGTTAAPINNLAGNTGLTDLSAAIPSIVTYKEACAITGPIYYYDGKLKSSIKFPPHFNGAWIIGDFNYSWIDAVELDKSGANVLSRLPLLAANAGGELNKPGDIQMGPDGALYIMNYSGFRTWNAQTGLLRVEYHGSCQPVATLPNLKLAQLRASFQGNIISVEQAGPHELEVRNLAGQLEFYRKGSGLAQYDLRDLLGPGIHLYKVTTPDGYLSGKSIH
jgi:cytochrome c